MRKKKKENKIPMKNITCNLSQNYEDNLQKLIDKKIIRNRSEAIRTALRDFLREEYDTNLDLLGYTGNGGIKNESEQ